MPRKYPFVESHYEHTFNKAVACSNCGDTEFNGRWYLWERNSFMRGDDEVAHCLCSPCYKVPENRKKVKDGKLV